ncbi:MAG TPA: universal stress protein [Candidatus Binataceae bacterium]|nr:universal stress protein [Candidatus Binataceae bacterium]
MKSKFEKILCPIDFSDNSLRALDSAIGWARRDDALVYLMNVEFVPAETAEVENYVLISKEPAQAQLEKIARQRMANTRHQIVVEIGKPAELIEEAATRYEVDLIAMATHSRKGVDRLLLGSVAEHVVRTAKCPVLTFGPGAAIEDLKRILCPVDFDENSFVALEFAYSLAKQSQARLEVLHVVTLPFEPSEIPEQPGMPEWKKDSLARLQSLVEGHLGREAKYEIEVRRGDAATEILESVKQSHPDLMVLATHGRTGISHLFLGSVAEHMVRASSIPVLTIRGKIEPAGVAGSQNIL